MDARGRAAPEPDASLRTVPVPWEGAEIARIHVEPRARDSAGLVMALTPELLAGIDGQRLSATLSARVSELQRSRARVVRRADEERRRLERDLHDGAQQHLLALGLELRTAIITSDLADEDRDQVELCIRETGDALDRLREIAHGAYPSLLASSGLEPAMRTLTRRSGATLSTDNLPTRLPHSVEGLAYTVAAELLARTHGSGVRQASVRVGDGRLVVDVDAPGADPSPLLRERVGALDGSLERVGNTDRWRLIVPCA